MNFSQTLNINQCLDEPLEFGQPNEIGQYSIDGKRNYHDGDQQKKYLARPSKPTKIRMDLNVGLNQTEKRDNKCAVLMEHLLRWIKEHKTALKMTTSKGKEKESVDFVTLRGTLKKILCVPKIPLKKEEICAVRFKDVIYLCRLDPEDAEKREMSEEEKKMSSWGYKFEQFMTKSQIDGEPNTSSTDHELEEYCIIIENSLNGHSLLYKAETDCIDPERLESSSAGSTDKYVELKLSRLDLFANPDKLHSLRFLTWWAQSYVVGIPETIFGLRDSNGIVKKIVTVKTSEMAKLGQKYWSKSKCISFCNQFLIFVKSLVTENYPDVAYRFYQVGNCIRCQKLTSDIDPRYKIIPDWYIEEMTM